MQLTDSGTTTSVHAGIRAATTLQILCWAWESHLKAVGGPEWTVVVCMMALQPSCRICRVGKPQEGSRPGVILQPSRAF